jgi:ATP-binding cassette subfamily B protein
MDRARDRGAMEGATIVDTSVNLLTGLVGVIATAAAVTVVAPVLLPCLLLAAIPAAVTAIRMARREYLSMLARFTRRRRLWMLNHLMANRQTAAEIRTYQMRGYLLGEYQRIMAVETAAQLRLVKAQTGTRLIGAGIAGLATFAVYVVLGVLLLDGWVPLAAAATALLALQAARTSLNMSIHAANTLYEDALYFRDFNDFIDRANERVPPVGGRHVDRFGEITLHGVSLQYPDTDTAAVDGVTLTLKRGQVIALVGENGSGKSSLARLIAGLYAPSGGRITWDGVDIDDLDPAARAAHVGVISQDWWKFPFTAGQNITIGRHDRHAHPDGPTVQDAAAAAAAHDMITGLPQGYDTLLSRQFKDGHDLSGGQWQRLVSARGLYRDARLLICDEPSSALDARAEHAIFEQLLDGADRTTVLITHRLANVRFADHIYVMHDGKVIQDGTHDQLIADGGLYQELFHLQASGYIS